MATIAAQQIFQRTSVTSRGLGRKTPSKLNLHGRRTLQKA
jgi:hypothetical protein